MVSQLYLTRCGQHNWQCLAVNFAYLWHASPCVLRDWHSPKRRLLCAIYKNSCWRRNEERQTMVRFFWKMCYRAPPLKIHFPDPRHTFTVHPKTRHFSATYTKIIAPWRLRRCIRLERSDQHHNLDNMPAIIIWYPRLLFFLSYQLKEAQQVSRWSHLTLASNPPDKEEVIPLFKITQS